MKQRVKRPREAVEGALTPVGEPYVPRLKHSVPAHDPDRHRLAVDLTGHVLLVDVVRLSDRVMLDGWIDDERLISQEAGEGRERVVVMYLLLRHRLLMAEAAATAMRAITEYYEDTKKNHPEAWEGYKALGKENARGRESGKQKEGEVGQDPGVGEVPPGQ